MSRFDESTRFTYRHRGLAREIIASLAKRRTTAAPALALADFLLRLHGQPPQSLPPGSLQRRALDVVWAASGAQGRKPPTRHAFAQTVLHLAERMLGFSGPGQFSADRQRNSECGTYATPDFIARSMLRDVLRTRLEPCSPIDALDLSVEAGQFPLTLLQGQRPSSPLMRYHAIDRDQTALDLAKRIFRFAAVQQPGPFTLTTTCRDSLLAHLPRHWPSRFDLIVGNPPWQGRDWSNFKSIRDRFGSTLSGRVDTYLAFMLRAHELLKPGGYLSMVIPQPFLFNLNAAAFRELLLDQYDILALRLYPQGSFVEVFSLIPISFLARKRRPGESQRKWTVVSHVRGPVGGKHRLTTPRRIATQSWRRFEGCAMNPVAGAGLGFLLERMTDRTLADFGVLWSGGRLTRSVTTPTLEFAGVHGRDVRPFHLCRKRMRVYDAHMNFDRPPRVDLLNRTKVVFQDMRNPTHAERLVAAVAAPGSYPVSTASMFVPEDHAAADYFEALLNSSFANAWYKARDVSRSIKLTWLADLPVVFDQAVWRRVARLARQAAAVRSFYHRRLPTCTTRPAAPTPYPEMDARLAEYQRLLDREIFDLHDFSSHQRRVIGNLSTARVF